MEVKNSFWGRPFCRAHRSKTINSVKHFAKVADRSEKNITWAHKWVFEWWDLLSTCKTHVMTWEPLLRPMQTILFPACFQECGLMSCDIPNKKISCSDLTVASSGHISLLKPVQNQPWTLPLDSLWYVGEMNWLMIFILFLRGKCYVTQEEYKYIQEIFHSLPLFVIVFSAGRRCWVCVCACLCIHFHL